MTPRKRQVKPVNQSASLISRLQEGTKGSRELDAAILCAIRGWTFKSHSVRQTGQTGVLAKKGRREHFEVCEDYTFSLDAAMTLVPERYTHAIEIKSAAHRKGWRVHLWDSTKLGQAGDAATPAIALCIAALKARGVGND